MKDYIKMVVFIVVLGVISAGVLIGVDILTKSRIEANKLREFQETILNANGIDYNSANLEEEFAKVNLEEDLETGLKLYTHTETLNVSFEYRGNGLWGPIYGVITLEKDFKTIVNIVVLEQEETPGLGAVVGEKAYLAKFVGVKFNPLISINKSPNGDNEVDSISGATGTSVAFEKILNDAYTKHYQVFRGGGILTEEEIIYQAVLNSFNYDLENDDRKLIDIINENFVIHTKDDYVLYEHLLTGSYSFYFITGPGIDQGANPNTPIEGVLTLAADFDTITRIVVINHGEVWGAGMLEQRILDKAIGKSINGTLFKHPNNPDGEIDGETNVTITPTVLNKGLKDSYEAIKVVFTELPVFLDVSTKKLVLDHYGITYNEDLSDVLVLFANEFKLSIKTSLLVITKEGNTNITYVFTEVIKFGRSLDALEDVTFVATLKEDLDTIVKLDASYQPANNHWGKTRFLDLGKLHNAIDAKMSTVVFKTSEEDTDGNIDGVANVTGSINDINKALKDNYEVFINLFKGGNN